MIIRINARGIAPKAAHLYSLQTRWPASLHERKYIAIESSSTRIHPMSTKTWIRCASTATQAKEDYENAASHNSDLKPVHPLSAHRKTAKQPTTSSTRRNPASSKPRALIKSRISSKLGGPPSNMFSGDSEMISELSRQQSLWEDDGVDMFDMGSTESQIVEAGAQQVSDAFEPRDDTQVYMPHDIEHLAEMEHLRDAMGDGDHLNTKPKKSHVQSIPRPHFVETPEQSVDGQEKPKQKNLEMHFTYGMSRDRSTIPSRFDWRKRATSRGGARDKTEIKRRTPAVVVPNRSNNRWMDPLKAYREKFLTLQRIEYQSEEQMAKNRLTSTPKEILAKQGFCIDDVAGTWIKKTATGFNTASFARVGKGNKKFRWNKLTTGSAVRLSRNEVDYARPDDPDAQSKSPIETEEVIVGSVLKQESGRLTVMFPRNVADLDHSQQMWRIDLWVSDIVLRRTEEAFATLSNDPPTIDTQSAQAGIHERNKRLESVDLATPVVTNESILSGTTLKDILLRDFEQPGHAIRFREDPSHPQRRGMFGNDKLMMSWCARQLRKDAPPLDVEGDPDVSHLNGSQRKAIALMLSERVSLIQGPPGTGKTRTIIEALQLLKMHWQVPFPILVTGYTNTAVDNLAEGLQARGLKVLRYGAKVRIRHSLWDVTLDGYIDNHKNNRSLHDTKKQLAFLAPDSEERLKLQRKLWGLERYMMDDIAAGIDVVCATCISSVSRLLQVFDFPVVFFDEASMATEAASIIPLTKGCSHLAVIGDHKQLPPVVISPEAKAGGFARSLFERLIQPKNSSGVLPMIMLDTQYRMHPEISAFPIEKFYNNTLKNGTVLPDGSVRKGLEAPDSAFLTTTRRGRPHHMSFIDHDDPEVPWMGSIQNLGEAEIVSSIVLDILINNPTLTGDDIGVIAPYAAQIGAIQQILHDEKKTEHLAGLLGTGREQSPLAVEISTVDGFEGREKKIIVFSTTRSNPRHAIGFMDDWRRLNVALTRAQRALIMVGNYRTLSNAQGFHGNRTKGQQYWIDLMRTLKRKGAIRSYRRERSGTKPFFGSSADESRI